MADADVLRIVRETMGKWEDCGKIAVGRLQSMGCNVIREQAIRPFIIGTRVHVFKLITIVVLNAAGHDRGPLR